MINVRKETQAQFYKESTGSQHCTVCVDYKSQHDRKFEHMDVQAIKDRHIYCIDSA